MSAAKEAKNPNQDRAHDRFTTLAFGGIRIEGAETMEQTMEGRRRGARTWEVVKERYGGGAADDGVDPEPPPGAKDSPSDARGHDWPRRQKVVIVHRGARWPSPTPATRKGSCWRWQM